MFGCWIWVPNTAGEPVAAMGDMIYLGGGCGCTFYGVTSCGKPQPEPGSTPPVHHPKKLKNLSERNPGDFGTVQSRKDSPMICDLSVKNYEVVCHVLHNDLQMNRCSAARKPPRRLDCVASESFVESLMISNGFSSFIAQDSVVVTGDVLLQPIFSFALLLGLRLSFGA